MRWAKNSEGEIVEAQRSIYSYGLRCPYCNEPVRLRKGHERRPHFAHYSNRAKPDCENYFPPYGSTYSSVLNKKPTYSSVLKKLSLQCGLFLANRPQPIGFSIFLRLPSLDNIDSNTEGQLVIQHRLGEKIFRPAHLTRANVVPFSPQVPLFNCLSTENLTELSKYLSVHANAFTSKMNIFNAIESGGRIVLEDESLEWGKTYWIINSSELIPPVDISELLKWSYKGEISKWHIYEATLPSIFAEYTFNRYEHLLSNFFCRKINAKQSRAYLKFPLPHHIDVDGAYIYPDDQEAIFLKRNSRKLVRVDGPEKLIRDATVRELSNDLVRIDGLHLGKEDVAVLIDDIEQFLIRKEPCELLQPTGVVARTATKSWNILENIPMSSHELNNVEIRIKFPNSRLARKLAKLNKKLLLNLDELILEPNSDKIFLAEGFGGIFPRLSNSGEALQDDFQNSNRSLMASEVWIYGLVREKYGVKATQLVRNYIENPDSKNLNMLGQITVSSLMPYIHAATKKLHN